MTAGLPGTGIGGLYYVLLALWMPFREIGLTLSGRRDGPRRRVAALEFSLAVGILAALWGEAWLLRRLMVWIVWHTSSGSYWHAMSLEACVTLLPAAATWITITILSGVILTTHALRLCIASQPVEPRAGESVPAAAMCGPTGRARMATDGALRGRVG